MNFDGRWRRLCRGFSPGGRGSLAYPSFFSTTQRCDSGKTPSPPFPQHLWQAFSTLFMSGGTPTIVVLFQRTLLRSLSLSHSFTPLQRVFLLFCLIFPLHRSNGGTKYGAPFFSQQPAKRHTQTHSLTTLSHIHVCTYTHLDARGKKSSSDRHGATLLIQ